MENPLKNPKTPIAISINPPPTYKNKRVIELYLRIVIQVISAFWERAGKEDIK